MNSRRAGVLVFLVIAAAAVYYLQLPNSTVNDRMDQFLLFGDSITQQAYSQQHGFSFFSALSDAYIRRLDIVNRGLSGYNTRQALHVLPQIMPDPRHARVRMMTIFLGANDSRLPNTPGDPQQHIPLEEFKQNIKAIVNHAAVTAHQGIRIILITPPPVDDRKMFEAAHAKFPEQAKVARRTAAFTAQYAQAVREVGHELSLPVLDIWKAMIERAGGKVDDRPIPGSEDLPQNEILAGFVHDGLHLTGEGYKVLCDELMALVETTWPDQMPGKLPFVLPTWDNVHYWETRGLM